MAPVLDTEDEEENAGHAEVGKGVAVPAKNPGRVNDADDRKSNQDMGAQIVAPTVKQRDGQQGDAEQCKNRIGDEKSIERLGPCDKHLSHNVESGGEGEDIHQTLTADDQRIKADNAH